MELVDLMPLHPVLTHPHTGEPLHAIFQLEDGEYVWPLLGADGEDDGANDEDKDDNESDDEESDEEDTDDDEGESKSGKAKSGKSDTVSREEFERIKKRMQAADKNRAAVEKERDELKRKDQTELENAKQDLDKRTKEFEKLQGSFTNLARTNAFLIASQQAGIAWHNPKVAQKAAELGDLEIDEDGNVDGIDAVVKKLAKEQPYLVNKGKDSDEEEDEGKPPARRGTSGSGVGSTKTPKGKKNNGVLSDEDLRKRFPSLR